MAAASFAAAEASRLPNTSRPLSPGLENSPTGGYDKYSVTLFPRNSRAETRDGDVSSQEHELKSPDSDVKAVNTLEKSGEETRSATKTTVVARAPEDCSPEDDVARMHYLQRAVEALDKGAGSDDGAKEAMSGCALADSVSFKFFISVVVVLNTIQLGLEADNPQWASAWRITENVCTSVFFVEFCAKLFAWKLNYFSDRANWLDMALTWFGVVDCWLLSPFLSDSVDLQSMSILRILRLARLGRVARVARQFRPLVLVLAGVWKALATTFWVFLVLVMIIYVCAIFCTEYIGRSSDLSVYPGYTTDNSLIDKQEVLIEFNPYLCFGTMRSSMLTLFNIAVGGEWTEIVRPMAIKQPFMVVLFLVYSMLVAFGIMNVMIGIVVDSVLAESKRLDLEMEEQRKESKKQTLERIQKLLEFMDTNVDSVVDLDEMRQSMRDVTELQELLEQCDLPAGWTAHELHTMLDNSGDGLLQTSEFTTNFFRLMNSDDFQQICIMQASINQVKHLVRQSHEKLEIHMAEVRRAIRKVTDPDGDILDPIDADTKLDDFLDDDASITASKFKINKYDPASTSIEDQLTKMNGDIVLQVSKKRSSQGLGSTSRRRLEDAGSLASSQCEILNAIQTSGSNKWQTLEESRPAVSLADHSSSGSPRGTEHTMQVQPPCAASDILPVSKHEHGCTLPLPSLRHHAVIGAANPDFQEPAQDMRRTIPSIPCKQFAAALDVAFLAMKESLYREMSLPMQSGETRLSFRRGEANTGVQSDVPEFADKRDKNMQNRESGSICNMSLNGVSGDLCGEKVQREVSHQWEPLPRASL